ncbi:MULTISPECIES: DUF7301 family protein [Xenorhabdus]|uniref:DUF7301 family protein n=1 Tax=Xenorhabdus TaxID=626 RepID=UPI00064B089C|nr:MULTISPECIES: hypothetical protein [Xenorhabdus]KLU15544.1 hypothetical protein AAY47_10220 [Xenorhabdus griffiniae]KOP34169.1 hypothetical protein AFK69_06000 [Xenorhabdus sp. GDc328]WFQ80031.1 hypothetical protein PXH59_02245 [Xenorhabdus sp. SF857]
MKKLTTASELLKADFDVYCACYKKWRKNARNKPGQRPPKMTKSRRDAVLRQIVQRDLAAGMLIFRG